MTIHCISAGCGTAYIQGYPGPIFDDSLTVLGWEHTPAGWVCPDCNEKPASEEEP